MDIITKVERILEAPKNTIVIGDLRDEMSKNLLRNIEMAINKFSYKDDYYMLIHAYPDRMQEGVIHEKIFIIREDQMKELKEEKMLGTICLYINNKTGEAKREWVLPLDIPNPVGIEGGEYVPSVAEDAKGLRIIH